MFERRFAGVKYLVGYARLRSGSANMPHCIIFRYMA